MCLDGVFMENHVSIFNGGQGTFAKEDKYYPCSQLPDQYRDRCYVSQAYSLLRANEYAYTPTFADCEQIPSKSPRLIGPCIGSVANYLAVRRFLYDLQGITQMCQAAPETYQLKCIKLAVFSLVRYVDQELGDDFCQLLPPDKHAPCLQEWHRVKVVSNLP